MNHICSIYVVCLCKSFN